MASITLEPSTLSAGKLLIQGQWKTKPRPPPKSISLQGQVAIVTGSNTGIGFEAARELLELKLSHVILAVRSMEKGEAAAARLQAAHPSAKIEVWKLDMSSYESIRAFAQRCAGLKRIDILLLNAGLFNIDFVTVPSTGHEEMVQVNYLSTAMLAILMIPILREKRATSNPARMSITGSTTGLFAEFPEKESVPIIAALDKAQKFGLGDSKTRYDTTKLLVLMLVLKLSQLVSGDEIVINNMCPGSVGGTDFSRKATGPLKIMVWLIDRLVARTPEQGAWTLIDAVVVKGKESHGCFLNNWEVFPFAPMMYTPEGRKIMERIWDETLQQVDCPEVRDALRGLNNIKHA